MSGLEAFIVCFDLHSLSNGIYGGGTQLGSPVIFVSAQEAVNTCKLAYSKDAWDGSNFNFGGDLPTSGNDLFGWYIFERGNAHLIFDADEPLTKELSKSILINNKRFEYYRLGETPDKSFKLYQFNYPEQLQCFTDIAFTGDLLSVPISCVLGSFYYQIKTVDNGD